MLASRGPQGPSFSFYVPSWELYTQPTILSSATPTSGTSVPQSAQSLAITQNKWAHHLSCPWMLVMWAFGVTATLGQ